MLYDTPYTKNLKRNDANELIYKTETDSQRMNLSLLGGRAGWGERVSELGMEMYTLLYKIDNQQRPTA